MQDYSEKELKRFLSFSRDFFVITDLRFFVVKSSSALMEFSGYATEDLIGKSAFDFVYPEDLKRLQGVLADALIKGLDVFSFEVRFRAHDGSYKWIEWSSKPNLPDGLIYSLGRDISERKKREEEFKVKIEEIERHNKLMIGREKRIIELKGEIDELLKAIGKPPRYDV